MEGSIIILFIFIILKLILSSPKYKGQVGEKQVAKYLCSLDEEEYKVINDIILNTNRGSSQIDHIVISVYGIFVIETKNYKGWILGNDYDDYWRQIIYKRKEKLRNPVKQNYGHIKALQEILGLNKETEVISIVAFTKRATIKVNSKKPVIYTNHICRYIKQYNTKYISKEDMNSYYNKLLCNNVNSKEMRKEHIKNIRTNNRKHREKIHSNICPRCGGELVIRNGSNGQFKGCSNFPKCRFTSSI